MQPSFAGLFFIVIVSLIVLLFMIRFPHVGDILLFAYLLRLLLVVIHSFLFPLPDSQADALKFERIAWEWAQAPFGFQFLYEDGFFISWLISIFYRIFGRDPLIGQSFSLLFGTLSLVLAWMIAKDLWGREIARRVLLICSIFPSLNLYSALILRESYIWFFTLIGIYGVLRWSKTPAVKWLIIGILGFGFVSLFHGGITFGFLIFLLYLGFKNFLKFGDRLFKGKIAFLPLLYSFLLFIPFILYFLNMFPIYKIGYFEEAKSFERVSQHLEYATEGGAAYPLWTIPRSYIELVWKFPVRVAYFLFSPFPWDLRALRHLVGFVDGLLYLYLAMLIWKGRKKILSMPDSKLLFLLTIFIIAVFALGTSNFGTAIRHRTKVVFPLILLSVGYFMQKYNRALINS